MSADVTVLDLRLRRRALIGYAVGLGLYALVIVALYPSFKNDTSLNKFTENGSAAAALFGANGPITTPTGWLNANLYANFVPLVSLLLTIGYGASCLAGQDEDGTLGLIAALPIARRRLVIQKLATLSVQAIGISIVTALCAIAGRGFDLTVSTRRPHRSNDRGDPARHRLRCARDVRRRRHRQPRQRARHHLRPRRRVLPDQLTRPGGAAGSIPPATRRRSSTPSATGNSTTASAPRQSPSSSGTAAALLLATITAFNRLDVH